MTEENTLSRVLFIGWVALIVGVSLVHSAYYFPRVVDDMFISLRYAENLVQGNGPVFNIGERVEGVSSFSWMLLQAFGAVLHTDLVTWTKLLGVLSLLSTEVVLYRLGTNLLGLSRWRALIAPSVLAFNSYAVNWSVLGLETPLYLLLLFAFPLTYRAYLQAVGAKVERRSLFGAVFTAILLSFTRPEAPLYVFTIACAEIVGANNPSDRLARLLRTIRFALPTTGIFLLLIACRYGYYGHLVPHTYFVKGVGPTAGFSPDKLAPLWGQGASTAEALMLCLGTFACIFSLRRDGGFLAAIAATCLFFTSRVESDWMPSLRHLLPITLAAPLALMQVTPRIGSREQARTAPIWSPIRAVFGMFVAAFLLVTAVTIGFVDYRRSPADERGRGWVQKKSIGAVHDVLLAYQLREPAHIQRMDVFELGQVSQAWPLLEAAASPLESSWLVGRDIGLIGYASGTKVFDTAGLFTPAVVRDEVWSKTHRVSSQLIDIVMALRPVSAQLYDGFEDALGQRQELLIGYDIIHGSPLNPFDIVAADRLRPDPAEVLRRYRTFRSKLPTGYHIATLYGESVGAAIDKRIRHVATSIDGLLRHDSPNLSAIATFDGEMRSYGCVVTPSTAKIGAEVVIDCTWSPRAPVSRNYRTFLHFDRDGEPKFAADHAFAGGFVPTTQLRVSEIVHDVVKMRIPPVAPGAYTLRFGLFQGERRAGVTESATKDPFERVLGPTVNVQP